MPTPAPQPLIQMSGNWAFLLCLCFVQGTGLPGQRPESPLEVKAVVRAGRRGHKEGAGRRCHSVLALGTSRGLPVYDLYTLLYVNHTSRRRRKEKGTSSA